MTGCLTESRQIIDNIKSDASKDVELSNIDLVSGFDIFDNEPNKSDAYYLGKDVEIILECDAVVFIGDKEGKSRGCKVEHAVADAYNIKQFTYDGSISVRDNFLKLF